MRFKNIAELRSAAQELALKKWNSDSTRPTWDRDGKLLRQVARPVDVDALHYLTEDARKGLRPRGERDARYKKTERAATRSMRSLYKWVEDAKKILATLKPSDVGGGAAIFALQRLLQNPDGGVTELERVATPFQDAGLFRADEGRLMLTEEVGTMLERKGAEVNAPVIAWASVLCGHFPDGIGIHHLQRGVTPSKVLEEERRLIARALQRHRKVTAHS
jgi:hypothetical protein